MSVKRYAIAAGAAALVFSGVYGAAAGLNITGGAAQAGVDDALSCDDSVHIEGLFIEQGTGDGPESFGVVVSGIDSSSCNGFFLTGRAIGTDDGLITLSDAVEINGETVTLHWTNGGVPVEDIAKVGLAIT